MLNILAQSMQGDGVQLATAAIEALIGFLIVIAGIALLIFIIWLAGFLIKKFEGKKKSQKAEKKVAPVIKSVPTEPEKKSAPAREEVPDQVKAAIIAAIMAYYSAEKPKAEFIVKRIKRI